jgi:hypothetical protein
MARMANSLAWCAVAILACASSAQLACRDTSAHAATLQPPSPPTNERAPSDDEACAFTERLRRALLFRTAADGSEYGLDDLDPALWWGSSYFLISPRYDEIESMLAELDARNMIPRDPLRRAMLQRDLWAIFDQLVQIGWRQWPNPMPLDPSPELRISRVRHLSCAVARALARIALSASEIDSLPNNLQDAMSSRAWPAWVADEASLEPFLPTDLLDPNGDWVELRTIDLESVTPRHDEEFACRSVCAVLMRLPSGRASTLDYLRRLREFPDPLIRHAMSKYELEHPTLEGESTALYFNPNLPQFPVGTALALIRKMLLFDSDGRLHVSNVVESVQIRRYRRIDANESLASSLVPGRDQHTVEFVLDRDPFIRGEHGGLRAVAQDEKRFRSFMSAGIGDPVTNVPGHKELVLQGCMGCHGTPGIYSVDSYTRSFPPFMDIASFRSDEFPHLLVATNVRFSAGDWTVDRKSRRFDWGMLQGMLWSTK